ncbi:MAG TPA: hypothetical protein VFZ52_19535, partial [Chryseolinea sp.]
KKTYIGNFFATIYAYLCYAMGNLSERKRRISGLFLEVLVLIFVFGSSWPQLEAAKETTYGIVLKAIPIEQIAFRDSDQSLKSLLDFTSKIQICSAGFTSFQIDLPTLEIANSSCLVVPHSLYNSFYTHLTAKAP